MIKGKKKNTLLRLATGVTLAMALSIGMAAPAFAAEPAVDLSAALAKPAQAAIAKILQMPAGTTAPDATFTFTIAKTSLDDKTDTASLAAMPDLGSQTVSFTSADATDAITSTTGTIDLVRETGDLFAGINWPHAGVYVYTVTEEQTGAYTITNPATEQMTYSKAEYELSVYVLTDATTGKFYVAGASAKITKLDDGKAGPTTGYKKNPTPGTNGTTLVVADGKFSAMTFTNSYLKKVIADPTDPASKSALTISKTVVGSFADTTKPFAFDVTVNNPTLVTGTTPYKAYVMGAGGDANGIVQDLTVNVGSKYGSGTDGDAYIEFTPGPTAKTVYLTSGQTLFFVDLYVGSAFTVTEVGTTDYTASCILTLNGIEGKQMYALEGKSLTAPDTGVAFVSEGANSAAFTNEYKTVTPTGISVDTLPFIMMIGAVVLALIGYVFAKTRKNAKDRA